MFAVRTELRKTANIYTLEIIYIRYTVYSGVSVCYAVTNLSE